MLMLLGGPGPVVNTGVELVLPSFPALLACLLNEGDFCNAFGHLHPLNFTAPFIDYLYQQLIFLCELGVTCSVQPRLLPKELIDSKYIIYISPLNSQALYVLQRARPPPDCSLHMNHCSRKSYLLGITISLI